MKSVAIVQSNYIPWKGYFDLINSVDEFILLDDAQYTKRDWRNRNIIKTASGLQWLTIPVQVKGHFTQKIKDVKTANHTWGKTHFQSLVTSYSRAKYFKNYAGTFEALYLNEKLESLSEINYAFIKAINKILGINTKITWSMDYAFTGNDPSEKLLSLCQKTKATHYLSGPLAKNYLRTDLFKAQGIEVTFYHYENYPVYNQLYPPFDHKVTILDLIFNEGDQAPLYMQSFDTSHFKKAVGA